MVAYVGLSYRHKERDDEHHGLGKYKNNPNKSPVYKFSAEKELPNEYLDTIYSNNNELLKEIEKYGT